MLDHSIILKTTILQATYEQIINHHQNHHPPHPSKPSLQVNRYIPFLFNYNCCLCIFLIQEAKFTSWILVSLFQLNFVQFKKLYDTCECIFFMSIVGLSIKKVNYFECLALETMDFLFCKVKYRPMSAR